MDKKDLMANNNVLLADLKSIIEDGKKQAVKSVNSFVTLTYWKIGKRINNDILHGKRAEYGKNIVQSISYELTEQYGKSFELRNLRRMMQFAETFPDFKFVSPLVSQLSWTH